MSIQTRVKGKDKETDLQSIGNNAIQHHGKAASTSGTSQIAKQKTSPSFAVIVKLIFPPSSMEKKLNLTSKVF